jgi:hypothetical protein
MSDNTRSRRGNQSRRSSANRGRTDLWRAGGPLPDVEPVSPAGDPTALIRSLGDPPLTRGADTAVQFALVVERSAAIAAALAHSAELLVDDGD